MALSAADSLGLIASIYRGRWFMMYASFMIMSAAGATYVFAVYSKDIKATLGYNQTQLNRMSFYKDLGANFGIISGLINELMPTPAFVLIMGAGMNFAGYFMIYLAITGKIAAPKLWQMCMYIFIGANSQGFANTGSLVPCVMNFPESRGIVLGLLKGFVGVSGAIFTQLYHAVYGEDSKSLVLLIAWLPAVISLASIHSIRIMKVVRQPNEFKVFCDFLYISISIAVYLLIVIIIQKTTTLFTRGGYVASAFIILIFLLSPIYIVSREGYNLWLRKREDMSVSNRSPVQVTVQDHVATSNSKRISSTVAPWYSNVFNPPPRGEDYSIPQAIFSIDLIMIFVATAIGTGGTLTAMDNMGQIGESLGYDKKSVGTFVSLMSIWNYAGRVSAGFVSEILIKKYKFPRPLMQAIILVVSCFGHALIAFPRKGSVYIATVILGFTFGAQMPMFLAMISELFGLKHYSTLFNVGVLSSPLGSYVFNVEMAGKMYDREARRQGAALNAAGTGFTCMGTDCYKESFLIITLASFFAALVMLTLTWRTKEFYGSDIYAKFRDDKEISVDEREKVMN